MIVINITWFYAYFLIEVESNVVPSSTQSRKISTIPTTIYTTMIPTTKTKDSNKVTTEDPNIPNFDIRVEVENENILVCPWKQT